MLSVSIDNVDVCRLEGPTAGTVERPWRQEKEMHQSALSGAKRVRAYIRTAIGGRRHAGLHL